MMKSVFTKMEVMRKSFNVRDVMILSGILTVVPHAAFAGPVLDRLVGIACNIANYMFTFALVAAVSMALIASYKYMTAGGDSAKVSEAHRTILYAAIGVAVALIAGGFPGIIAGLLGEQLPGNAC